MSIRSLVVGLAMSAAACGGAAGPAANPAPATPAAPAANRPSAPSAASLAPPPGYMELVVEGVVPTPHGGPAVVLRDASSSMVLPIFVGGTEALSIDLRHAKKRYARPLTHDLFDEVVEKLGGKVVRVQIDGVRDDTFVGSVIVSRGAEIIELDARPSDAIALALGNGVPILVSPEVIKKASIMKDDLEKPPPPKGEPPPPTDRREL